MNMNNTSRNHFITNDFFLLIFDRKKGCRKSTAKIMFPSLKAEGDKII